MRFENGLKRNMINELRKSVGWREFSQKELDDIMEYTRYSVVAYDDQQVIAMGRVIGDGVYYLICDVVVSPQWQQMGIGKQVIQHLLDDIKSTLHENESCSVQLVSATGKEGFYQKLGFSRIPNDRSGSGMQMFIF